MRCYKAALQIQKRLFTASDENVSETGAEISETLLENSMLRSDAVLNVAISDALSGIGFLYADKNHSHSST
jgi:hypothetical protein